MIYLNFLVSVTYAFFWDKWAPESWILFAVWNTLSGFWGFLFSSGTKLNVLLSQVVQAGLLIINELLWESLTRNIALTDFMGQYSQNSFAICLGWLIAANNVGLGVILVYYLGVTLDRQVLIFWIMTPICY